ncbi:MAG: DUF6722 family protein [Bacteroidota bacterium]|nr:DUF6722 family protein [Bacteroidota bacterium]
MAIEKETKKEIGKFLIDIAKLIFGGVILASLLKIQIINPLILVLSALFVIFALAVGGFMLVDYSNKK